VRSGGRPRASTLPFAEVGGERGEGGGEVRTVAVKHVVVVDIYESDEGAEIYGLE